MLKTFACGTASFKHQDDDPWHLKKARRSKSCRNSNNIIKTRKSKKNLYSSRGLDKFTTLLAELEGRKEEIYAQIGSPEESLVRFGYSNTNEWVPIVVRFKEQQEANKPKVCKKKDHNTTVKIHNSEVLIKSPKGLQVEVKSPKGLLVEVKGEKKQRVTWRHQSQLYLIMVIVLILMCLVISGKSLAVLCTSIGWYLLPIMKEKKLISRNSMKKKDYGRWLSEKRMTSEAPVVVKSLRRGESNKCW